VFGAIGMTSMALHMVLFQVFLPLCAAVVFEQITWPIPSGESRASKDPVISGDGNEVVFASDADFEATGLATDADGVQNIWSKVVGTSQYTKVSSASKPSDRDAYRPTQNSNGSKICFESNEGSVRVNNLKCSVDGVLTQVTQSEASGRDAKYAALSSDGSTLAFASDIDELVAGVPVGSNKHQIYFTRNFGTSFTMVTPGSIADTSISGYPAVSSDGAYIAFRSKMVWPVGATVSSKEEAWLARTSDMALFKISSLAGKLCDTAAIYADLVTLHGQSALDSAGVSSVTTGSCPYAAVEGMAGGLVGTVGVGSSQPKISGDGRFITYTTNFPVADTFGSRDTSNPVAGTNLFLYDRILGMTWQVTKTGAHASGFSGSTPLTVEDFCCPSASSSKQRGSCSTNHELKGWCCWQKPCAFPALNSEISEDGKSIAFVSDVDYLGTQDAVHKDMEIWHYHIPTSSLTRITTTSDADLDDVFPKISSTGQKVTWVSDAKFTAGGAKDTGDYMSANQVWVATLSFGCSGRQTATNYVASPDVEECCTWPSVTLANLGSQLSKATVILTFAGDVTAMWSRVIEFSDDTKNAFCEEFVRSVTKDLSCALAIPPALIQVTSPATSYAGTKGHGVSSSCGDWASGASFEMTVDLLPMSPAESITGVPTPSALASELLSQHGDASSRLWKGYLTKLLKVDTAPSITYMEPRTVPSASQQTSAGSCYSMQSHTVACNVAEADCTGVSYPPGFVGSSGCCHCEASCDFNLETRTYDACQYSTLVATDTTTATYTSADTAEDDEPSSSAPGASSVANCVMLVSLALGAVALAV
jgi:Tol biopolymer transport system component